MTETNSQFTLTDLLKWLIFKIHTHVVATTEGRMIPIFNARPEYWHRWLWNLKTQRNDDYITPDFTDEIAKLVGMPFEWGGPYPKHPNLDELWPFFLHNYFNSLYSGGFIMLTRPTSPLPRVWEIIIAHEVAMILSDKSPLFRWQDLEWK
jgi:hypothetical protein